MDLQEVEEVGRSEFKVPGGKLLRARVETIKGKITFVQVTGDFFMKPETDLEELEELLLGSPTEQDTIRETVCAFFGERGTVITGASPEDFALVINDALR